jgi:hypothetical protein
MGLKIQRIIKRFGGFAAVNGFSLEIPCGPIGLIPAPRARKTGKRLHVLTNFLFGHLNLIPSLFQRFSNGERARAFEAHARVEITDGDNRSGPTTGHHPARRAPTAGGY